MTPIGILQIALYFALVLVTVKPLGAYMARVFEGQRTFLHPVLRWLERLTYKTVGVREDAVHRVASQLQHFRVRVCLSGTTSARLAADEPAGLRCGQSQPGPRV